MQKFMTVEEILGEFGHENDAETMRYLRLRQDMAVLARSILAVDGFVCSDAITAGDKEVLRFMAAPWQPLADTTPKDEGSR